MNEETITTVITDNTDETEVSTEISESISYTDTTNVSENTTIVGVYNYDPSNGEVTYDTVVSEITDENGVIWEEDTTGTSAETTSETTSEIMTEATTVTEV